MKTISLRHMLPWVLSALLMILLGCNQAEVMQKFASPEDQALAKGYVNLLRQQRFAEIEKTADPSLAGLDLHGTLVQMASFIPAGEPTSITLVGAHRLTTGDATTVNLTLEYEFSGKWLLVNVAIKNQGGNSTLVGFHVVPQVKSLQEQNKFTLSGKAPAQYAVLAAAILVPLFVVFALVVCIRTTLKGAKWPWVLFILFGVGNLCVNWSTGAWAITPIAFQLFGAGAFAPFYGPWTIAVSMPLGAVVFLLLRSRLRAPR